MVSVYETVNGKRSWLAAFPTHMQASIFVTGFWNKSKDPAFSYDYVRELSAA